MAMLKACNKGKGSEKGEEEFKTTLVVEKEKVPYTNVQGFELLLNKTGNQGYDKGLREGARVYYFSLGFAGLEMEYPDGDSGNADLACRRDTGCRYRCGGLYENKQSPKL